MQKTILVTGGAGFIGYHLCKALLEKGEEVVILDNLFTGDFNNVKELMNLYPDKVVFIKSDIRIPFDIPCDRIYNLACPASPIHYQKDPVITFETSTIGISNVLKNALKYKARVLQASTSEVYGDPNIHPQPESYWGNVNPIGIRSCYDEGKRGAETLMFDYHRQYGIDIRIIRIFNTYGPNMCKDDGRVISNFIVQALEGKDITIYGTGKQTRSFQYVSDLISGMIAVMKNDSIIGPVNLGNPVEFTMLELAETVGKILSKELNIVFKPLPQDDPKQRKPDISLAKETLGWEPIVPLADGLKSTIEYFKKKLSL